MHNFIRRNSMFRALMFILLFSSLLSCKKSKVKIIEQGDLTEIVLNVDWSKAGLQPNGFSIYVFDEKTGAALRDRYISNTPDKYLLPLPSGSFRIFVVNDTDEELTNVQFVGTDSLSTFRVVYNELRNNLLSGVRKSATIVESCDEIAVAELKNFKVANRRVSKAAQNEISVKPVLITEEITCRFTVENLSSVAGPPECKILNVSGGYYFDTKSKHPEFVHHQFKVATRTKLPDEPDKGIISSTITSFGPISLSESSPNGNLKLAVNFVLNNGDVVSANEDVNDNILESHNGRCKVYIIDREYSLPSIGGSGGAFNPSLEGWVDETVNLPLKSAM